MSSDSSQWIKFLHELDLSIDYDTITQYAIVFKDRFTTIEQFLTINENELINLGITSYFDRASLIKQVHLYDDKENLPLTRQSTASNCMHGHWRGNNQSTPVNPQSKCNLSPALLSRISFNEHPSYDVSTIMNEKSHVEHTIETPKRIDGNERNKAVTKSCQKIISPSLTPGMRPIKSLSDTVSLQKKIISGTERLKRLALPRSLFKRQTELISKKVSNITNKLVNPFAKLTNKIDLKSDEAVKITSDQIVIENSAKRMEEIEEKESRKLQLLKTKNNDIRGSTNSIFQKDQMESKQTVPSGATFPTKRFKLGATTTFLTRSLANHGYME